MSAFEAKSEISGRVFDIVASPGDHLEADDPIVILEAMKMEIAVGAPRAGILKQIIVAKEDNVEEGQVVAVLDPL